MYNVLLEYTNSSRMVLAALPAGVVYIFLWFVPPSFDEEKSYVKFIYYLCMYFAFQALLTVSFVTLADSEPEMRTSLCF